MYNPVAETEGAEREPISPRVESLAGKRIGLFNNGKPTAKPTLQVLEDLLREAYSDVSIEYYAVNHLNLLKNEQELSAIERWADEEIDVCIAAIGDCGSCTQFLVYGVDAVEKGGTPTVGLVDEGFALDYQSNAHAVGRPLRYYPLPELAEVTDIDRIRNHVTVDVLREIEAELTRPRTDEERSGESGPTDAPTDAVAGSEQD